MIKRNTFRNIKRVSSNKTAIFCSWITYLLKDFDSSNKCPSLYTDQCHFYLIDNDKPTVASSKDSPVEHTDNVILTCDPNTNDVGATFEWYKDEGKITGASSKTYSLPDNKRSNSGSYQCKVTTNTVATPEMSDAMIVTFLCECCF